MKKAKQMKISELISANLETRSGEFLGVITDILISTDEHRAEYLLVKLENAEEPISLRYSAAVVDQRRGCFVLNTASDITEQLLQ